MRDKCKNGCNKLKIKYHKHCQDCENKRINNWRAKNGKQQRHDYYVRNKVKISSYFKKRYSNNPVKVIEKVKVWRDNNYDKMRDRNYKKLYGLSLVQYNIILEAQGGVCALCKQPPKKTRLAIDHVHGGHENSRVRGLLCWICNKRLIGRSRREHSYKYLAAYLYLESTKDWRVVV